MCKGCPQVKWWYFNIIWLVRVQYMCEVCVYVCVCVRRTSCDPQHSHNPDDCGVDGQSGADLDLLKRDAHHWQQHNGQIQLVPPAN